jgi:ferric-dicitrate binding protein FerR (iron transport regulator)
MSLRMKLKTETGQIPDMTLQDILEWIGLCKPKEVRQKTYNHQDRVSQLEEEHKKALGEVEQALQHQRAAAAHVSGVAQKQADEAEQALKTLRGILRRSLES